MFKELITRVLSQTAHDTADRARAIPNPPGFQPITTARDASRVGLRAIRVLHGHAVLNTMLMALVAAANTSEHYSKARRLLHSGQEPESDRPKDEAGMGYRYRVCPNYTTLPKSGSYAKGSAGEGDGIAKKEGKRGPAACTAHTGEQPPAS